MFSIIWNTTSALIDQLNENLMGYGQAQLIAGTVATVLALQEAYRLYNQPWDTREIKKALFNKSVKSLESLPYVGPKVKAEVDKEVQTILSGIRADVDKARARWTAIETMPEEGLPASQIKERFEHLQDDHQPGQQSGAVYAAHDEQIRELLEFVYGKTAFTNPMHSDWPLINLMEAEVISMCQALFQGEKGAPGMITHGGTTSIIEACKTYVLHARANDIENPEIIVPDSAHVAFDKAAKILNARLVKIPIDKKTGAADVTKMEDAITNNTCMMVGSAPSFPFGIMDPVSELGQVAIRHDIPLHVDSCLGGFLTAFAKEAGFNIPACDFSVPGVNSISADTHKYGETAKGSSVLLFKNTTPAIPAHVYLDWVGGMYVSPGMDGSRSGADIATTWTVLCSLGKETYIDETKKILQLQRDLLAQIKNIDGIYVPFDPRLSVIPIQSHHGINSLLIADRLHKAGWSVNIIQTPDQEPAGCHFCITSVHVHKKDFIESFTHALSAAVTYAKEHPDEKPEGTAKVYGKLKKGVPAYVQERIGQGYSVIMSTLSGIWSAPEKKQDASYFDALKNYMKMP